MNHLISFIIKYNAELVEKIIRTQLYKTAITHNN